MILEAIFNLLFLIVRAVIGLFPAIPAIDTEYLDTVVGVISLVDNFVSLRIFGSCMIVIFTILNIDFIWSIIMWCVRKIPGLK